MESGVAIDLTVVLEHDAPDGVPFDYVKVVLNEVDAVVYKQELEDLAAFRQYPDFFQLDPVVLDALETRVRNHRNRSISRIVSTASGSLEITIAIGGLVIWLLEKTLGETVVLHPNLIRDLHLKMTHPIAPEYGSGLGRFPGLHLLRCLC